MNPANMCYIMLCLLHECVGMITGSEQSGTEQQRCDKWTDSETDAVTDTDGQTPDKKKNKTITNKTIDSPRGHDSLIQ